ncbi:phenylacetate--CoA ligase [Lentisphaerota bacterium WC36G]|nr:phenylacetate--CoA ligase [Lentisphaerae bacterium WC36]
MIAEINECLECRSVGIWDKNETLERIELEALQLERLKKSLLQATKVPFYQQEFAKLNIDVSKDINSLADLRKLPFTTKANMRDNYPLGLLAVPKSELSRFHGSSGTTGKPTFVGYTKNDLELWSDLCARFLYSGGLRKEHVTQVAFGYGLFTGGFGLHYGIEKVGASIIPASSGNTKRQIMLMQDIEAEILICTPSYALTIIDTLREMNIDPSELNLKHAFFGGEQWTEDMRFKIENALNIKCWNNYGLSEIIGPGVSGECEYHTGMHIQEDHFIVECLNPDTLEPVGEGETGELVITTLTKEAMPVVRYRTRDLCKLYYDKCKCGRTTARMGRVIGRSDDMLIIRGVNIFPSQIEEALLRVEGIAPHYLIEVSRPNNTDLLGIKVEMTPELFSDQMREMQKLKEAISREISSIIGIRANIELVAPNTLERFVGKAQRVTDSRNLVD